MPQPFADVGFSAIFFILLGALFGSIPFGYLVARSHGKDIREVGSGNIGMTNVWRAFGWKAGITVLLLDVLKGFLPVLLVMLWIKPYLVERFPQPDAAINASVLFAGLWVGLGAILGHTFTPWLRGRGGKGVATGLGVAIALFQGWMIIPVVAFLLTLAISRMVSLSSIVGAFFLALVGLARPLGPLAVFGIAVFFLVLYTHRSNIRRIIAGTENKVSFGRRRTEPKPGA